MDRNRVTVKIYGQEYTVADTKSEEEIRELAEYVDSRMRKLARAAGDMSVGSVAVLTAMVIADELSQAKKEKEIAEQAKAQSESDAKYYLKMWDDSKQSFLQYKDSVNQMADKSKVDDKALEELKQKCKEYESTCFDLQMENIQLKSKLEKMQ
ncbi:MAG: cell division protein ZapA [Clostridiales bacterium]|nr:cell division protein ZapA [Clostridiales bacterium]MDD7348179.1 cell division protein ZapA [Clostridiales bacterium]MDY4060393.1 cell division protein ZapA [Anaerovoracaceae bacterium]